VYFAKNVANLLFSLFQFSATVPFFMGINAPHLQTASNMSVFCFTGIAKPCLPLLLLQTELQAKEMKIKEKTKQLQLTLLALCFILAPIVIGLLAVFYKYCMV